MILILHNNLQVVRARDLVEQVDIDFFHKNNVQEVLLSLAQSHKDEFLIWCREDLSTTLDMGALADIFHHKLIMASYSNDEYLPDEIGYIEESPFIKVKKDVSYPTWQMSSDVGGIHSSALLQFRDLPVKDDFVYFLNSLAKLGQPRGLFCYSEPRLIRGLDKVFEKKTSASLSVLFRFVRQHYKTRWLLLLLVNFIIYQHRLPLLSFVYALRFRKRSWILPDFSGIQVQSTKKVVEKGSLDVIIPTIGRKEYLYQVLQDLKMQTRLPSKVIVVEQNPDLNSNSELDSIVQEDWPFKIRHIFTHRAGVCNARNLALNEVESEWIFFNDDDNRISEETIDQVFQNLERYGALCCITGLNHNQEKFPFVSQSTTFGSGYSFLKSEYIRKAKFSDELEYGYGEDKDFGMQLRALGIDVIYFPYPNVKHLNAPRGGFRTFKELPWHNSVPVPTPSPTLMWYKERHLSRKQLLGYKTVLFLNLLKKGKIKDIMEFNSCWRASMNWAGKLQDAKDIYV